MANHYLFTGKTGELLTQIIDDKKKEFGSLRLTSGKEGEIIYTFVIDAHEVGKYCFPIDILKCYKRNEFEEIVDSQIAYYDIFMRHHSKPIIFEEYEKELRGAFNHFSRISNSSSDRLRNTLMLQDAFFDNIKNIISDFDEDTDSEDFKVAFKLALMSFGIDRLEQVASRITFESSNVKNDLLSPLKEYKLDNSFINHICEKVKKNPNVSIKSISTLKNDVISVDKVNFLNKYFISQNSKNRIVYLSSAPRTEYILEEMKKDSNGNSHFCSFDPWRTPIQIYLYLMLRKLNDQKQIITEETIESLESIRELFIEVEAKEINNESEKRNIRNREIYNEIEKLFRTQKNAYIKQLDGAERSQLEKISTLYEITAPKTEQYIDKKIHMYFKEDKKTEVLDFLKRKRDSIREMDLDVLVEQIHTNLKLSDIVPGGSGVIEFVDSDNLITNCYEIFPFLLFIDNKAYLEILNELFDYWFDYYEKKQRNNLEDFNKYKILQILEEFLNISIDTTEKHPEYYTVSAMFHLINSNHNSDESSLQYISRLEKFGKMKDNPNLLYIKANILRRNGYYLESINLCDENKSRDYRFGYCKALSLIELIGDNNNRTYQRIEDLGESISNLIIAYDQIEKGSINHKEDFQSAICSNIVYLACLYFNSNEKYYPSPLEAPYIEIAARYIEKLKILKPKETWSYLFPDFYHAEAFFEYTTLETYLDSEQSDLHIQDKISKKSLTIPKDSWEDRLKNALADIKNAVNFTTIRKKELFYKDLQDKLEKLANNFQDL